MNNIDVEPRLALIEILSDFRGKLLIARRLNEKVLRPVFRRFAGAAPRGWNNFVDELAGIRMMRSACVLRRTVRMLSLVLSLW